MESSLVGARTVCGMVSEYAICTVVSTVQGSHTRVERRMWTHKEKGEWLARPREAPR